MIPHAVLDVLVCPVCGETLATNERTLRCPARHSFDLARHGYVNLRTGHKPTGTGDTAAMVTARAEFLNAGHYAPIAEALASDIASHLAPSSSGDVLVDVGAGTGYYLAAALEAAPGTNGIAVDVSSQALRRASRAHPRVMAVGADAWRGLPLRNGSIAVLLNVFAPRNPGDFRRVLCPDGILVVVTPTTDHLAELVATLPPMLSVDERKDERVDEALRGAFTLQSRRELTFPLRLHTDDVDRLIQMGPSAHHIDQSTWQAHVAGLATPGERIDVTAAVVVSCYRPANAHPAG